MFTTIPVLLKPLSTFMFSAAGTQDPIKSYLLLLLQAAAAALEVMNMQAVLQKLRNEIPNNMNMFKWN